MGLTRTKDSIVATSYPVSSSSSIETNKSDPGSSHSISASSSKTKKLCNQEYKEKREKGLCFYCDEKYSADPKCKNQKVLQLQIISEDGEEEDDWVLDEEEELETNQISLSLNSVEGITGISSIRLVRNVNGKEVGFLIDIGATHNFVDPLTANRLQLPVQKVKKFKIKVAEGER